MEINLDGFEQEVIEKAIHRLPKAIYIKSFRPHNNKVEVTSEDLSDSCIQDLVIRYCLDEKIRNQLNKDTEAEKKLIYAYALTGLLPEDLNG